VAIIDYTTAELLQVLAAKTKRITLFIKIFQILSHANFKAAQIFLPLCPLITLTVTLRTSGVIVVNHSIKT